LKCSSKSILATRHTTNSSDAHCEGIAESEMEELVPELRLMR